MSYYIPKRNLLYAIKNLKEYSEHKIEEGDPDPDLDAFIKNWERLVE